MIIREFILCRKFSKTRCFFRWIFQQFTKWIINYNTCIKCSWSRFKASLSTSIITKSNRIKTAMNHCRFVACFAVDKNLFGSSFFFFSSLLRPISKCNLLFKLFHLRKMSLISPVELSVYTWIEQERQTVDSIHFKRLSHAFCPQKQNSRDYK